MLESPTKVGDARPVIIFATEPLKVTLDHLGVTASYSRPRVSNDNPFSEALFRTCKYRPEWPSKGFSGIEAARDWVKRFATWYNGEHLHSGIRFVAPNTRHAGLTLLPDSGPADCSVMRRQPWSCRSLPARVFGIPRSNGGVAGCRRPRCIRRAQPSPGAGFGTACDARARS